MSIEIRLIPLTNIKPLFNAYIYKTFKDRMKNTRKNLQTFDLLLAVEKSPDEDIYILVGGYDRYYYLHDEYKETIETNCIVEEFVSIEETLLKTLRRLLPKGDADKNNKLWLIRTLQSYDISLNSIAKDTGIPLNDLKNKFTYSSDIPEDVINEHTIPKTLNEVSKLNISKESKLFLYKRAGLPKRNSNRLTGQVLSYIKSFIKDDSRVELLSPIKQILTFDQAFNPKKTILSKLKNTLNRFMSFRRTG